MTNQDPNRPEIITRNAWGGRSAVALGGNRYSTKSEALFRAANLIAIPARGLVVDAALWVASIAVLFRLPFSLMYSGLIPYYLGLAIMVLTLVPPMAAIGMVGEALPNHRPDCWARVAMLLAGVAIATNGFWVRAL
ncbi:hypothetical protein VB780_08105 [Leptolyngbya sp. CCNP1308]|uniref:hypothetical protein n=1 Tax=Leptolyngbya sp. CCNP1308 TaxID=3110255 RepID=UPI002B212187|nr:hypothetical protein [Leptolyngbya sp. CCNP1308]MEA5448524.1 hypothetical protein [Leptolyngbya sp. CCNP1308]